MVDEHWSIEEDKVFENALAQFWEHGDRCGCTAQGPASHPLRPAASL